MNKVAEAECKRAAGARVGLRTDYENRYRKGIGQARRRPSPDRLRFLADVEEPDEIFHIANNNDPIPLDMIRWRVIIKQARMKRGYG
jgi:hypothetical protein